MARFDVHLDDTVAEHVRGEAAAAGQSLTEHLRRRISVGREPAPYPFHGPIGGPSFLRDISLVQGWREGESREVDQANERLHRFSRWSEDNPIAFAPQTTTSAAAIIPPGYRPAITIPMDTDRPLAQATETLPLANATPFTVPRATGDGTIDATPTEGTNPTSADPTFSVSVVTPVGLAGVMDLTRELVDSAAPSGDSVALMTMREDWFRQAEVAIYNELNSADGQGGTITAGFVPSGAQARVSTTPATNLLIDLRKAVLEYANVRRRKARSIVAGAAALTHLGGLLGAEANTGDDTALVKIFGARLNAAVNDFGTGAGDMRIAILGSDDIVTFESPLAEFRFFEAAGPALVRCSVWGYFAVIAARPRGLSSIRFT